MTAVTDIAPVTMPDGSSPHVVNIPADIVSVGAGVAACEFAEAALGIVLDPWQRWTVLRCLAERTKNGEVSWAAFECAVITPRQNGKNFILEVIQLACLALFGDETLVHSAHKFDTSVEHFNRLKSLFEESDDLSGLLLPSDRSFVTSNGKEHIRLNTGQRILFKARYRGSSRGFTGDKVFLDEAFDLAPAAMGSTIPTLSTRPGAQVYYMSSAAHETSQVLHAVRRRALKDDPKDRLFYAEWGNPDSVLDLDPVVDEAEFMEAVRRANPAVAAGRISEEYIEQEIRTFSGDPELVLEHHRERLGVVQLPPAERAGVVPMDAWRLLAAADGELPEIVSGLCVGFDVAEDRRFASFGVAGRTGDGRLQIELAAGRLVTDAADDSDDPGWVVPFAVNLWRTYKVPLRVEKGSPAGGYISRLIEAGVEVVVLSSSDHAQSVGLFLDAVALGQLQHLDDPALSGQVQSAELRPLGDTNVWSRRRSRNVSGLVAATLALGGVPSLEVKRSIGMAFS